MPPSSSLTTLADFFRIRIIVLCKASSQPKAQIFKYPPQSNFPYHLFGKNYFFDKDIILAVGEEEGWRVIYGAHEREEVQILNTELDQLSEPEEVK